MKKYIRKGNCVQCGRCCRGLFLYKSMRWKTKIIVKLWLLAKGIKTSIKDLVCPNLRYTAYGKAICINYKNRPSFCREFPVSPGDSLIKFGCGYTFERQ